MISSRGRSALWSIALVAGTLMSSGARAALPPLIPRTVLFADQARGAFSLSPDGTRLAWLAGSEDWPANVWIETLGGADARRVTSDRGQGIAEYHWGADGRHILFRQDKDGDENWHIFSVVLATGAVKDLTPFPGVRAQDLLTSERRPNEILVGLNRRDPRVFDMYRVSLETGAATLEAENPGDVISWTADENLVLRACTVFTGDDAHTTIRVRDDAGSAWRDLLTIPFTDAPLYGQVNGGSLVAGFAPGGRSLYVVNPLGSDRTRLVEMDVKSGKEIRVIASHPRSDVEFDMTTGLSTFRPLVLENPATGGIQAVGFNGFRREWTVTDPSLAADFDTLESLEAGDFDIVNRTRGDSLWLVHFWRADGPESYMLYDRTTGSANPLSLDESLLPKYQLASPEEVVVKSRDGLDILCYLTVPPGVERKNLPLVLLPHGGPWWRDRWEFDPWVQLLANRGYVAIQPQYRGSTGFGKAFLNASNLQFGNRAVMGDFLDVVDWAVDSGLADPERLAVMGGSGGGYAALCCIAFHPDKWKCAVNVVGPSSVKTLLQGIPEYWKPVKRRWVLRFGDAEHDEEWNKSVSPLYHAGNIRAPLLMAYGLNDPRVKIGEAEQMAAAMRSQELPVTFVAYPDEGHAFRRPENNIDFFGRVEEFLAEHLGGRKEAWYAVPGSSAELR